MIKDYKFTMTSPGGVTISVHHSGEFLNISEDSGGRLALVKLIDAEAMFLLGCLRSILGDGERI